MEDVLSKLTRQSGEDEAERERELCTILRGTASKPTEGKKALVLTFLHEAGERLRKGTAREEIYE